MAQQHTAQDINPGIDGGTYEIIQNRLQKQKQELQQRLQKLNEARKEVFGSLETKLIATDRINTENNCIARDIVSLGNTCIFGYNVHFGLRTAITLSDVFSIYHFQENKFEPTSLELIIDEQFKTDFTNLYKYYRKTIFARFTIMGNYLHMVFQLSESITDIKTFKWLIRDNQLQYIDNRSDHELKFPPQYDFKWQETTRDMQRYGEHAHISILDKIFVETIGGDLTIKIEDNTATGKGILDEPVVQKDQTLDDGQYRFADLNNLIVLDIKPFQEASRYFVYNHKLKEVKKIDSIADAAILLPDDQGIIFSNGYYLQTGKYKIFDARVKDIKFLQKIVSPNGEDFLYVFYASEEGLYNLMAYNIIEQEVKTPILCNGFTLLDNGELCYFRTEQEQTRHHMMQIWQTPFVQGDVLPSSHTDSFLYKIGNKDIVRAMAESQELITLLNKKDNYEGLYEDIAKLSKNLIDAYYWLPEEEAYQLNIPLGEINAASNAAVDEFDKVQQLKKNAQQQTQEIRKEAEAVFGKAKSTSFKSIEDFVRLLTQLRALRGKAIGLKEVRYVDTSYLEALEAEIAEWADKISKRCVQFLLDPKALQPYHQRTDVKKAELEKINKVIEAKRLEEEVNGIAKDLELLIEIVSNLDIEDTAHTTQIIDNISLIFATINQLKANIKNTIKSLGKEEAEAEFAAQLKLVDQGIINYMDIAETPDKCDEYLNKVSLNLEELEGRFSDFEVFITQIIEKREEVYNAFESRKNALMEKRNKKAMALANGAERILKSVQKRAEGFDTAIAINGYFASDLMINKVRDIVAQLKALEDIGKAETLETQLKTLREDALRGLKDRLDLYEDGNNVIRLGNHKFGVNKQALDLTIVLKEGNLCYHVTGTDLFEPITDTTMLDAREFWDRELVSENKEVYRASYLAYKLFSNFNKEQLYLEEEAALLKRVQQEASKRYAEGYIKGVHDLDALKILKVLVQKHHDLGMLTYAPEVRAGAQFFWYGLEEEARKNWDQLIKASGEVQQLFPEAQEYTFVIQALREQIISFTEKSGLFEIKEAQNMALFVFDELKQDNQFERSQTALSLKEKFIKQLKSHQADIKFRTRIAAMRSPVEKIKLSRQWIRSFIKEDTKAYDQTDLLRYTDEVVCLLLFEDASAPKTNTIAANEQITDLIGEHDTLVNGTFQFDYYRFTALLERFINEEVPAFLRFKETKHELTENLKEKLKLESYKPRVLTSFVRNKLIDEVYFPLFGDNLAKQLGTVGDAKRTDRMGMLLLVSPPGYGKTTLMEYIANRLGLAFMKINGPAIGHEVTAVDPGAAHNAAARQELKKLNLAFEMGNNVMLYIDDIQHCSPEFLQKFISLSDGTRTIEGVYNGEPKTYDLRGKKFCVIMAGNPYTESGERFKIPDMLANRADIYNLGDIIGDKKHYFELSLIENAMTSNPVLQQLVSKNFEDLYTMLDRMEQENAEVSLEGNHTVQEINDYISVLEKINKIRDTVLKVNQSYIKSASMEDDYRTEPAFKLQGSYRDMNKLVAKVVPIMNDDELDRLLFSHYQSESQTLTSGAEANLLKYKELTQSLSTTEKARWETIKTQFLKNNKLKGFGKDNEMAQVLNQLMQFTDNLEGIKEVLAKGLNGSKKDN